jgi:hypothetical protein
LKSEGLGDLLFRRQVHADKYDADAFAGPLVFCQGRMEVVLSDESGLNQALADLLSQQAPSPLSVRKLKQKIDFTNRLPGEATANSRANHNAVPRRAVVAGIRDRSFAA